MTYEELKIEAEKLGYSLVKFKKKENFLPCTCGCNRRDHWYSMNYVRLVCSRCGKDATGETELKARQNWNKMIRELTNDTK